MRGNADVTGLECHDAPGGYTTIPPGVGTANAGHIAGKKYTLCQPHDPVLRVVADLYDVSVPPQENADLRDLVENMLRIVKEHKALGLAAPQVGVSLRVIVARASPDDEPIVLVNPRLTERGHILEYGVEACLSIPGVTVGVFRATRVTVTGIAMSGTPVTIEASGLLARVLQHEIDHLYGILITDYVASTCTASAQPSSTKSFA